MSEKIVILSEGAEGLFIKNERFKTTLISFNFFLPLKKETAALYALLPFILTTCSKNCREFSKLNYKLNKLYGARLDASVEKQGDYQLLKMTISIINDRYALDDDSLVKRACDLLLELIFEPSVENNSFFEVDVEREKRKAAEHIKGEYSDKRTYSKNRLIEEMYKGEAYGISKCGTLDEVESITGESLYKSWEQMLKTAFIRVNVIGAAVPTGLFEEISERFSHINRENITDCKISTPTLKVNTINNVLETQNVNQGKLVMGFASEIFGNDEQSLPLLVMCDIFGGGPYSKLFANVREKMSLCYYCSASSVRNKGFLMVESGVEAENAEKARVEILNQLENIKKGKFSDFEFESSVKSITDSFKTYLDSQASLDMWYTVKINNDSIYSPTELAERLQGITRDDIINTAQGVTLNTVYKLMPKEKK